MRHQACTKQRHKKGDVGELGVMGATNSSEHKTNSHRQRADIQGLRTVAILGVLLFHIWPEVFRNGFLGVDMFFVLSGFLMAQCLVTKLDECRSAGWCAHFACVRRFYARRVHRIVPVYVAVVYGTLSVGRTLFLDSDFAKLRDDMYWALTFTTNVEPVLGALRGDPGADYFAEVFAHRPLLHTWSLGVEMQFYLLAPAFLFILAKSTRAFGGGGNRRWRRLAAALAPVAICAAIIVASAGAQFWLMIARPRLRPLGFSLPFCRWWQFFVGIGVWFVNRKRRRSTASLDDRVLEWHSTQQFPFATSPALFFYDGTRGDRCSSRNSSSYTLNDDIGKYKRSVGSGGAFPTSTYSPTSTTASVSAILGLPPPSSSTTRAEASKRLLNSPLFVAFSFLVYPIAAIALLLLLFSPLLKLVVGEMTANSGTGGGVLELSYSVAAVLLTALFLHIGGEKCASAGTKSETTKKVCSKGRKVLEATRTGCIWLLTNRAAVWLGDLSYVWYLVHWPVCVFSRYFFSVVNHSARSGAAVLLATFVVAVLVDRLIDAHVRKLQDNFCAVLFLIGLIYTFCVFFMLPTYWQSQSERMSTAKSLDGSLGARMLGVDVNFTRFICDELQETEKRRRLVPALSLFEKIKMNELMQKATFDDRYEVLSGEWRTDEMTRLNGILVERPDLLFHIVERKTNGTGSRRLLLVGNSHADIVSRSLQHVLRDQYAVFHTFTIPGCMPMFMPMAKNDEDTVNLPCGRYAETVLGAVRSGRFDTVFMAFKWYRCLVNEPLLKGQAAADDAITRTFQSFLDIAQKHVQRIFFPAPNLVYKHLIAKELAKRLWQRAPLDDLHLNYTEHRQLNKWSYERVRALDCPKCTFYDIADEMCDRETDRCLAFDEEAQLAYLFDNNHLSYLANLKIRPFLRRLMVSSSRASL